MESRKNRTPRPPPPGSTARPWVEAFPLDPRPITLCCGALWLVALGLLWFWSGLLSGPAESKGVFSFNIFVLILLAPCSTLGAGFLSRHRPRLAGAWLVGASLASTAWFVSELRGGERIQARDELGWTPLHFMMAPMLSLGLALLLTPPKSPFQKKTVFLAVLTAGVLMISTIFMNECWRSILWKFGARP